MKAFAKLQALSWESVFSFCDHGYCNLIIGLFFHHVMMQDELMLVFQDAYFDTQLNRHAGLTFAYPFGVRLK